MRNLLESSCGEDGLSHALAQPDLAGVLLELCVRFRLLQPKLTNDASPQLLDRLRMGELDHGPDL